MKNNVNEVINEFLEQEDARVIIKYDKHGIQEIVITRNEQTSQQNNFVNEQSCFEIKVQSSKSSNACTECESGEYEIIIKEISDVLQEMGIPAHILGYHYIRDAVYMVYSNFEYINSITKVLYPEVAKINKTTPSKVERGMRHAIDTAWKRGNMEVLEKIYGYTIDKEKGRPTNSEFIAMLADELRLRHNKI